MLIGTTSGGASLTVGAVSDPSTDRGAVAIKAVSDATGIPANLYLQEASGAEGYTISVNADGDLNFHNSGITTPTVTFADNDNVGLGTASPSTPLHVVSSSGTQLNLERTGTTSAFEQDLHARTRRPRSLH